MESEESRGDTVEDQQAAGGGGEIGEAATQVIEQEEEDGTVQDEHVDESKEEGEVVDEEEEEDKAANEENETLEKTVINNNSEEAEDGEEEGLSDSKDELEDKGGGEEETEEGVGSMDEVEGQPNEEILEGEEETMDDGDAEETEQLEESHGGAEAVGDELEEEAMEEGEEEEEENGERPGAVEEEDEEEERMEDIREESTDGQVVKKNAAAVMAASGVQTRKRTLSHSSTEDGPKRKVGRSAAAAAANVDFDCKKHDKYCWVCHKESVQVNCKLCPRSYHVKCMSMDYPNAKISQDDSTCICPECVVVMNAETLEFRSDAMKQLTLDQLLGLLKNICLRMRQTPGSDPFVQPVDPSDAEDYFDYIVYPMDIETLEKNIRKRLYGSTEGFLADAQWLVHNSIVFNSASSQYSLAAKRLLKVCKQELTEIETCPECYTNAHEKPDSWFVEACRRPHILVWAKLKGFPFWPAKAMKIKDNDVDVRFFGQHDRAWVSKKDCFLYSEEMPAPPPKKNGPLLAAIEELTAHVEKLKEVHGPVLFASVKTPIGPQLSSDQIRRMLPEFTPQEQGAAAVGGAIKVSSSSTTAGTATTSTTIKPSNNNNNNNNNSVKVPPPTKISPMTIRISSLKTNPTIVNISTDNSPAADGRVVTRLTRKSSSAASTQQSNNPSGESDQDQSNDEGGQQQTGGPRAPDSNKGEDNEDVEEDEGDNVPEQKTEQDETEEEEAATTSSTVTAAATQPSLPKGSEILASALGGGGGGAVRRSTRGLSRSGEASESSATATPTSATPQLEKRLTRGALKTTTPAEDGNNGGGDSVSDEQPSDAVMEALGLSKKSKETAPSGGGSLLRANKVIKEEPQDDMDVDESEPVLGRHMNKSAHNTLMEQLTIPTSVKPGYRFNLSKDISISAVEGGGMVDQDEQLNVVSRNVPQQRRIIPGGQQRSVPQGIPMNAVRPRLPVNTVVNGQPRSYTGQQLRQMVRNARPQHILNPRTGQTIRIAGAGGGTRPVSMLPVRGQQQQYHVQQQQQQKASKDAVVVDTSSLVNPVQGPITLPGGTITVTPLTSLIAAGVPITAFDGVNGAQSGQAQQVAVALKAANASGSASNIGIINVQQQTGGGTTIVNSKQGKTGGGGGGGTSLATAQQRRNLMVSIPPSVNMHLQNLTKTMGDLVKSTVEQITLEIVEFCNNTQGKAENSRLQVEVEKLQKQLKQDVTDIKHNNDIAMRELRMTMENDKKRSLQEVKWQMEAEKQKAIEETKKKQWCASCGREALFYCCWNTSYCGYPCQEEHWPTHMASCSQSSNSGR